MAIRCVNTSVSRQVRNTIAETELQQHERSTMTRAVGFCQQATEVSPKAVFSSFISPISPRVATEILRTISRPTAYAGYSAMEPPPAPCPASKRSHMQPLITRSQYIQHNALRRYCRPPTKIAGAHGHIGTRRGNQPSNTRFASDRRCVIKADFSSRACLKTASLPPQQYAGASSRLIWRMYSALRSAFNANTSNGCTCARAFAALRALWRLEDFLAPC